MNKTYVFESKRGEVMKVYGNADGSTTKEFSSEKTVVSGHIDKVIEFYLKHGKESFYQLVGYED